MRKNLWVCCLLAFLPGCISQTHYNELMGMIGDVKVMKKNDKEQARRIERMEKVLHQLQSGLRPEVQHRGVKVEPVMTQHASRTKKTTDATSRAVRGAPAAARAMEVIDAVKVALPQAVLFASGSAQISPAGERVLAKVAKGLRAAPKSSLIRIVGHSDSRPVAGKLRNHFTDNWVLSAARAAAVARVFIWGENINKSRIRVEGVADVEPVADGATAAGRAKNRRIEIFVEKNTSG